MGKVLTNRNRVVQVKGLVVGTGGITGAGATSLTNLTLKVREASFGPSILDATQQNILAVNANEKVFAVVLSCEGVAPGGTLDLGVNGTLAGGAAEQDIIVNNFEADDEFFNSLTVPACPINSIPDFDAAGYIILTSGGDYQASSVGAAIKAKLFYYTV